ncbi:MAG: DNA replication/repair protein RecF [Myxococcales bacterium]|nr:DNA replication/repair protein RecF [Myxococcales bacterium]
MLVRALKFAGFRNLAPASLEPGPRFNVFAGDNGQGKTNLLEALYVVCTLRSFRSSRLKDLISIHDEQAYVGARVARGGLERRYELTINARSRVVRLDNKAVRPIARYFGNFNVVLFAPEDLLVAKGSPGERRRFLDRAVFTLEPAFLAVAQDFEKVLKSRNVVLRDEQLATTSKEEMLAVYDHQLAKLSAQILLARLEYLNRVHDIFAKAFEEITRSGLPASLSYDASGEVVEKSESRALPTLEDLETRYLEAMMSSRRADLGRGSTNVGPHRDILLFELAGQAAGTFASQGQLRAMILAWKTAEMDLLAKVHEDPPALLLDDVSSELDPKRNEYLFEFLRERDNQCFISTTHPKFVLLEEDRRDFSVESGRIELVS